MVSSELVCTSAVATRMWGLINLVRSIQEHVRWPLVLRGIGTGSESIVSHPVLSYVRSKISAASLSNNLLLFYVINLLCQLSIRKMGQSLLHPIWIWSNIFHLCVGRHLVYNGSLVDASPAEVPTSLTNSPIVTPQGTSIVPAAG